MTSRSVFLESSRAREVNMPRGSFAASRRYFRPLRDPQSDVTRAGDLFVGAEGFRWWAGGGGLSIVQR
jgi:hypothetical protein